MDPPTLRGGESKASGLVLLKSDILMLESLSAEVRFSHENLKWVLNSSKPTVKDEYAFRPTERKTHGEKDSKGDNRFDPANSNHSTRNNKNTQTYPLKN